MNHRVGRSLAAALALVALAAICSCANFTRPITPRDRPTGKEAFVYGRFKVTAPSSLGFDGHSTIGFVLKCADKHEYRIRFDDVRPLVVLSVGPSTCSVTDILFTNADGEIRGTKPFPGSLLDNMQLAAGNAYYLGDYTGEISDVQGGMQREYRIESMRDVFAGTTRELKAAFPNLDQTPKVDVLDRGKEYSAVEQTQMTACVDQGVVAWHVASTKRERSAEEQAAVLASGPGASANQAIIDQVYAADFDNALNYMLEFYADCAARTASVPKARSKSAVYCLSKTMLATITLDEKAEGKELREIRAQFHRLPHDVLAELGDFYNSLTSREALLSKTWDTCMAPVTRPESTEK